MLETILRLVQRRHDALALVAQAMDLLVQARVLTIDISPVALCCDQLDVHDPQLARQAITRQLDKKLWLHLSDVIEPPPSDTPFVFEEIFVRLGNIDGLAQILDRLGGKEQRTVILRHTGEQLQAHHKQIITDLDRIVALLGPYSTNTNLLSHIESQHHRQTYILDLAGYKVTKYKNGALHIRVRNEAIFSFHHLVR